MNNYKRIVESLYDNIIKKYNLSIVSLDDSEVFLVGKGFALSIGIGREGVDIYYIVPDKKTGLQQYRLSNSLQDRFTDEDRNYYDNASTIEEHIIGELKVFASGLFNHWDDLLQGDKSWFKNYQGRGIKSNIFVSKILVPIFEKQKY